jgi:hypothetical protein
VGSFQKAGLKYTTSALNRSEIYLETGPLLAQGRVRLIDSGRLASQLRQLERRTAPTGKDRVDHGPGLHDDLANAAMGAIRLAALKTDRAIGRLLRPEYSITGNALSDQEAQRLIRYRMSPIERRESDEPLSPHDYVQIYSRRRPPDSMT